MEKDNLKHEQQCAIHGVSSSTVIEPSNCELSDDMKAHIEMMEYVNENSHKYATKVLMIPKEYFGSK